MPNLIPAVPIVLGAGGLATDFEGAALLDRKLSDGRCNVVYTANKVVHAKVLELISRAREKASSTVPGQYNHSGV
eukprot:gene23060-30249_t